MTCASSEQTNHNKCGLAFGGECQLFGNAVVADRSGRQLYRNTLTTDFTRHFIMITTFQMLCNKISSLVCQAMPSHSAKSHDVFELSCKIYSLNAFPSPNIRIKYFSHKSKNTSSMHKNFFCELRDLFLKFGVSITRF